MHEYLFPKMLLLFKLYISYFNAMTFKVLFVIINNGKYLSKQMNWKVPLAWICNLLFPFLHSFYLPCRLYTFASSSTIICNIPVYQCFWSSLHSSKLPSHPFTLYRSIFYFPSFSIIQRPSIHCLSPSFTSIFSHPHESLLTHIGRICMRTSRT